MDDEPMWAADRVVALTPGSTIAIPETANEFYIKDTKNDVVRRMIFPLSLTREAKTWLDELNEGTIEAWDELQTTFISRFFPPGNIIKIFYHGLSDITQEVLNAAAGGLVFTMITGIETQITIIGVQAIDVIDEILEEDFDALLDEGSKVLHFIEGTLLEEEIFSVFDEFMAMTANKNSESESNTEEPPVEKITINTDYKIKTSNLLQTWNSNLFLIIWNTYFWKNPLCFL
nr:reverse transcriptase domain-containing protein [Tanacetum cinerariifolium]